MIPPTERFPGRVLFSLGEPRYPATLSCLVSSFLGTLATCPPPLTTGLVWLPFGEHIQHATASPARGLPLTFAPHLFQLAIIVVYLVDSLPTDRDTPLPSFPKLNLLRVSRTLKRSHIRRAFFPVYSFALWRVLSSLRFPPPPHFFLTPREGQRIGIAIPVFFRSLARFDSLGPSSVRTFPRGRSALPSLVFSQSSNP